MKLKKKIKKNIEEKCKNISQKFFLFLENNFLKNDFQKVRLKISFYYLFIILIVLNLFIGSLFFILKKESQNYQEKIKLLFHKKETIYFNDQGVAIVSLKPEVVNLKTTDLINYHNVFVELIQDWIWKLEFVLIFLSSFLSYYFAGVSMKPIEEKEKREKQLLLDVSHELKNPLSALKITLDLVKNQDKWEKGELYNLFNDLKKEVERLIKITEDLLFLENKKKKIIEKIDLSEEILNVVSKLKILAERKNIEFLLNLEKFNFKINKTEFQKMFYNLLHNALKFSKANGKIEISLNSQGVLKVKDYGVGIKKEDLKNIFEPFFKVDDARTFKDENGSGLGLSIVKKIAEKNGIKIEVKSKYGEFTEFMLYF